MRAAALAALAALAGCGDTALAPPVFDLAVVMDLAQPVIHDLAITSAGVVTVGPGGGNSFAPSTVTIHAGESVTWNWVTGAHSIVSSDAPPAFAASAVQSTGQFTHQFMNAGSFAYHCGVHGAMMTGTVVVQ